MAWTEVAQGTTAAELEASAADIDLSAGTKMKLEITTYAPIAQLADLWGAEWVANMMLDQGEAEIIDVEGVGDKIIVHMRATGAWIPIIIAVIIAIIAYFGWQWFKEIRLFAEKAGPVFWGFIGLIGAAIVIPLIWKLVKKEKASGK